jgi:hypothetical protein
VFDGYQDYLRDEAIAQAERELRHYQKRIATEAEGMEYDAEALAASSHIEHSDAEDEDY